VRVQYTRADEHAWESYGQAYTITISAAGNASGGKNLMTAWRRDAWTSSRGGRPGPPANMASGILMGFPETPQTQSTTLTPSQPLNSVDGSNSGPLYIIPAARLTNHTVRRSFLAGPLRSPSRIQNTFANESIVDELAHSLGADSVQFRLDNLQDSRMIAVIQAAAQMAGWKAGPAAAKVGTGRLLRARHSAHRYEGNLGSNALVVDLTVDTKTGKVSVDHAWSAQDCGPAINNGRHEAAGRGLPDAGCQPLVDRGAEVERERRHEQRLGDLSGDPVHRDASEVRLSSTARTSLRSAPARCWSRTSRPRSRTGSSTRPGSGCVSCRSRRRAFAPL
jgi:hypothetical protein